MHDTTNDANIMNATIKEKLLIKYRSQASCLFFLAGFTWLLLLPLINVTTFELKPRGTYFSENALMAGAKEKLLSKAELEFAKQNIDKIIQTSQLIPLKFKGLKGGVVSKSFTAADRRECIVVVNKKQKESDSEVLFYSLIKILHQVNWLSKDIVFISTTSMFTLNEWLNNYFLNDTNFEMVRAGPIRNAIVIDLSGPNKQEAVLSQGSNGQLPNLDLLNVAFYHETPTFGNTKSSINAVYGLLARYLPRKYALLLSNALVFLYEIAFGPNGWHSLFLSYNIDSLTVQGNGNDANSVLAVGRVVEEIIHTLSNLEERLHHSYYFYFLLNNYLFVSIEEYLFPVVLLIVPFVLDALYLLEFGGGGGKMQSSEFVFAAVDFLVVSLLSCAFFFTRWNVAFAYALFGVYVLFCNKFFFLQEESFRFHAILLEMSLAIIVVTLGTLWFPFAILSCFYFVPLVCVVLRKARLAAVALVLLTNVFFVLQFALPNLVLEEEFFGDANASGQDMLFFAYDHGFSSFLIFFIYFVVLPSQLYIIKMVL